MVDRKNHNCFNNADFSMHHIDSLKTLFNDLSKTMKNLENMECKSKKYYKKWIDFQ